MLSCSGRHSTVAKARTCKSTQNFRRCSGNSTPAGNESTSSRERHTKAVLKWKRMLLDETYQGVRLFVLGVDPTSLHQAPAIRICHADREKGRPARSCRCSSKECPVTKVFALHAVTHWHETAVRRSRRSRPDTGLEVDREITTRKPSSGAACSMAIASLALTSSKLTPPSIACVCSPAYEICERLILMSRSKVHG